jgi:anti-sigma factor RsiW
MVSVTHHRFRRAVDPYVDGELDLSAATRIAHHLAECEGCRQMAETVLAIKRSLRRLTGQEPPNLAATRLRRWAEGLIARS